MFKIQTVVCVHTIVARLHLKEHPPGMAMIDFGLSIVRYTRIRFF